MTNPFDTFPTIQDESPHEHPGTPGLVDRESDDELTKGSTPKNVITKIQNFAIPAMLAAICIWLFLPGTGQRQLKPEAVKVEVNEDQQEHDSGALIKRLRDDADAKAMPKAVEPIVRPAGQLGGSGPAATAASAGQAPLPAPAPTPLGAAPSMPPGGGLGNRGGDEDYQKVLADQLKRFDEIRASPLEASSVKLLPDDEAVASNSKSKLSEFQLEAAAAAEQRAEMLRSQQLSSERAMASMAKSDGQRPRSSNEEFLAANAAGGKPVQLQRQNPAHGETVVHEGTSVRSVLTSDITSELQGRVKARVSSDVYDSRQRYVVIPKGSELLGNYNHEVAIGQERMLIAMNRLILPNGTWVSLAGSTASGMGGQSGVQGDVNNHFWKMFSTSLVLGGTSLLLPRSATTVTTVPGSNGSSVPTAGSVFAMSLNDVMKTILDRNKTIAPTISLHAGQEFTFVVAQDMALSPYRP
jgi:type IV secretory pathway VirB10-like protein